MCSLSKLKKREFLSGRFSESFFFSAAKMSYSVITNSNITKQTVALALISIILKYPVKIAQLLSD